MSNLDLKVYGRGYELALEFGSSTPKVSWLAELAVLLKRINMYIQCISGNKNGTIHSPVGLDSLEGCLQTPNAKNRSYT